jgi:hypothetical protein
MFHVLEFVSNWWADLEQAPGGPLEQVLIRKGTRRRARVRPHSLPGQWGPVESADLCFEDGSTALGVHYAAFAFAD